MSEPAKRFPDPRFADDAGEADPVVLSVLAAFDAGQVDAAVVESILVTSRVLVPVIAVRADDRDEGEGAPRGNGPGVEGPGVTGPMGDKRADMAMVTITGRDGRRGLPVFTSVAALQGWNREARPVPVRAGEAALAALDDGADALLVDPSPRPRFVVTGERLALMAAT